MHDAMPASVNFVYLADYAPPPYLVDTVVLDVDIRDDGTVVGAILACRRNPDAAGEQPLTLDGEGLETLSVSVDGRPLAENDYALEACRLTISGLPERFVLETRVRIQPDENTALSGFYRSQDGYFTQCEAQGFRRITWFPDRPDVMARYTVTLHADKAKFPVLLANGNPVAAGDASDGRHYAVWEDPFAKPCYLFAMVAGRLDVLRDTFTTASGRRVHLSIYVEPGKLDQCGHAMESLKKAMRWDEERFGLECDLDHYMIVAVGDFNMGAMENKGLNIFNTKYVLARPDIATDTDFENIDRVVAHEYFHNWTGNRVTCRDWFQLSLKEGLTVFRDQEFGADTHSRETARIKEVRALRAVQFPEDAGPMAHPVRPSAYVEINNFYTATVYEKGAEVVRMLQTLIGRDAFRAGLAEYFRRHDGQAVTCEDFIAAMTANLSPEATFDIDRFMRWYREPGTPKLAVKGAYDAPARRYALSMAQSNARAGDGEPYLMPIRVALFDADGGEIPGMARTLRLDQNRQTFVFESIDAVPIPSLLRDFSAPVTLDFAYRDEALARLLVHERDPFNRWEAGQRLFGRLILADAERRLRGEVEISSDPMESPEFTESLSAALDAARRVLTSDSDPAFIAEALTLPGEATLAEQMATVDPEALHAARNALARALAGGLEADFAAAHARLAPREPYRPDAAQAARRRLRNLCLAYLNELDSPKYRDLAIAQCENADNMTDRFAALSILVNADGDGEIGEAALAAFYERYRGEPLVVDKWLAVQAGSRRADALATVARLTRHPAFDLKNPNKVYALLRTFGANHVRFHAADGSGYRFLAARIAALDPINPQVAARLARCFDRWRRFDAGRQADARAVLEGLRRQAQLSRDVSEILGSLLEAE